MKNYKVNGLFDNGSHCNFISESLIDELALENNHFHLVGSKNNM